MIDDPLASKPLLDDIDTKDVSSFGDPDDSNETTGKSSLFLSKERDTEKDSNVDSHNSAIDETEPISAPEQTIEGIVEPLGVHSISKSETSDVEKSEVRLELH